MPVIANATRAKLAAGELALGLGLRQARTVDIAPIARSAGFDWLFIDLEHSSLDLDCASQIAVAALATGVTPVTRVPGKEHHHAARALDNGAQGVVIPHVDDAAEARRMVEQCLYPPLGHRSVAGAQPMLGFDSLPVGEMTRAINAETLIVIMLESPRAIAEADAIAALPGVDVVFIGTNDLCAEMGIPGQYGDARVADAYRAVIDACRRHGKYPGMGGVYEPALMERYIGMGMQFILSGSDTSFLLAGARERARVLRGFRRG